MAEDIISILAKTVSDGLDELFTSDEERLKVKNQTLKILNQPHIIQALTTLEETKHNSLFVSGWRPALGWLCVFLLSYIWFGRDLLISLLLLNNKTEIVNALPLINANEMMTLVLALLGLGGVRMVERVKGVARTK
ncbi:hypothetical protein KCM76_16175 [Zooshikella marina]|uniref:3TM-type holin n=1 Tax=Zooshikella ganghwensis TaxID=202772 RepID=UPI001BAF76FD|nr:3TM-type holin [Zooshikella ganghwensis]MBU2707532.1 hypothetical protein [Zooshikella ganghwensis]